MSQQGHALQFPAQLNARELNLTKLPKLLQL
jgi:hypothetical protein